MLISGLFCIFNDDCDGDDDDDVVDDDDNGGGGSFKNSGFILEF